MASGSFSLTNTGNTSRYVRFDVSWNSTSNGSQANSSNVYVEVKVVKLQGSTQATSGKYNLTITLDNQTYSVPNTNFSVSPNNSLVLATNTFTIGHNADGTKSCNLAVNVGGNVMWGNGSIDITLDTIPRYATINQSLSSKTETSITMNWNTDASISKLWYSTNNGSSYTEVSGVSGTSGNYTISGLTASTSYNIKTKVRRADSGLDSESSNMAITTYDYPYLVRTTDFIIGNNMGYAINNPLSRSMDISILGNDNSVIRTFTTTYGSGMITFSASEIEALYNSIPNSKTGTIKFVVVSAGNTSTNNGGTYTINESNCIPEYSSITYQDTYNITTAITGDNQILISGYSKTTFNANGISAKNGASIVSADLRVSSATNPVKATMTISGTTATANNVILDYIDTSSKNIYITITDSRGLTYTNNITTDLREYTYPNATYSVKRQSNYYSNTDFLVNANYTQIGSNSITIRTRQKQEGSSTWSNYATLTSGTTTTISLDNNYYWNIEIELSDALNTQTYTTTIQRGIPVFYIDTNKNSLGVNCFPEYENDIEVDGSPINTKYTDSEIACGDWFGNTEYMQCLNGSVGDYVDINTNELLLSVPVSNCTNIIDFDFSIYDKDTNTFYKLPYVASTTPSVMYLTTTHDILLDITLSTSCYDFTDGHDVIFNYVVYYTKTQG